MASTQCLLVHATTQSRSFFDLESDNVRELYSDFETVNRTA
jgi:hypothetical protein